MMAATREHGTTLVEVLVGVVIGLIVAVGILDAFAGIELRRRNTVGLAEADAAGTLATFILTTELANAGNGIAAAASALDGCPDTGDPRTTLRPIPVLISAGANAQAPDAITVNYAAAPALAGTVTLAQAASAGDPLRVQAPLGFATGDTIVAVAPDGRCASTIIGSVSAPYPDGTIALSRTDANEGFPASTRVFNRGPLANAARVRYDVAAGALRSQDLSTPDASPNPIVSGIVHFRAQYGIDSDDDGYLDAWVGADSTPWRSSEVLAMPAATLARIKAIRFGFVARSDAPDPELTTDAGWVMFDCPAQDKTRCRGRLTGIFPALSRYRVFEAVIPMRNAMKGAGS